MLKIQRASAGSGKTYTLTKVFILNYISVADESGKRRLLKRRELPESLRAILAITFTNKATQEMKDRIVEKLHALAWSQRPDDKIDYLSDFIKDYGWTREEISSTSRAALDVLLREFSSFNVSTIDSFFQSVLRTFTYEAELPDSYQVDIDDKKIAKAGFDDSLEGIAAGKDAKSPFRRYLKQLMQNYANNEKDWNVFNHKENNGSLYTHILKNLERLGKEDFKQIKESLEEYFAGHPELDTFIKQLRAGIMVSIEPKRGELERIMKEIEALMRDNDIETVKENRKNIRTCLSNMRKECTKANLLEPGKIKIHPTDRKYTQELTQHLSSLIASLNAVYDEVHPLESSEQYMTWKSMRDNMAFLDLLRVVMQSTADMLRENSTIRLSDTNTLLRDIISDDETPFIYERLGTRLRHFLIDEFQDTSKMQWENLLPLVAESEAHDYENLIIGDAKQSIYRFRNAAPELIISEVPATFPDHIPSADIHTDPEGYERENSNHRSARKIVQFNNALFSILAQEFDRVLDSGDYYQNLYSNVAQLPKSKDEGGYVMMKVSVFEKLKDSDEEQDSSSDGELYMHYVEFGNVIQDMRSRGYKYSDIAILVTAHTEEEGVIKGLEIYNSSQEDADRRVAYISENALKLKSSPAVSIVIDTLATIASGRTSNISAEENEGKEEAKGKKVNWYNISADYNFYAATHPELSISDKVQNFLREGANLNTLKQLLSSLPTQVLPALVEGIIESFIPEELRNANAPYLSALQDLVIDYCAAHTADISSFLDYWEQNSDDFAIIPPADMDAVQIMTVHKSKGLEFKCVILPNVGYLFTPKIADKAEWMWVEPRLLPDLFPDLNFPPYMPVTLTKELASTPYAAEWEAYRKRVAMDRLNLFYVACTRAVDELYIYVNTNKKAGKISELLSIIMPEFADRTSTLPGRDIPTLFLQKDDLHYTELEGKTKQCIFEVGEKRSEATQKEEKKGEITPVERKLLDDYPSYVSDCLLHFRPRLNESGFAESLEIDSENPDDDDSNPRAFGTLMHSIMEDIYAPEDIPRALRRIRVAGRMSATALQEAEELLKNAVVDPRSKRWFDGSGRVVNERAIILDRHNNIPDRLIIYPDKSAEVIDYKFGKSHSASSTSTYEKQVRRYMELLGKLGYAPVRGYLWYMRRGEIVEVNKESKKNS